MKQEQQQSLDADTASPVSNSRWIRHCLMFLGGTKRGHWSEIG